MIGTKLAHYEITSHLGSGGMGDVYQATDAKLGRSVAIKLLPEAFTHDAERAARFEREARVLASLNHPNIAAIHGIEESGGRKFLVMELVTGETLAERIKRGPIPVGEALTIAKEIAEGLEAAHENRIIHRDLKPANVKITPDGKVKVLDFGLAKAFESEASPANLSQSPTLSLAATNAGVILGTAAYMSPEQAKGRTVDRRTDIFAFGCLVYEMLTGLPTFEGEDLQDILGAVLKSEPDWTRLPAETPPGIRKLLRLCLEKNVKNRRQAAGDVRIDIEQALAEPKDMLVSQTPVASRRPFWIRAAPSLTALVLGVLVAGVAGWTLRPASPPAVVTRFASMLGEGQVFTNSASNPIAISPDGTALVYAGTDQLYLRAMADVRPRPIPGTALANTPIFSPDGHSLSFYAASEKKLKKIAITGGAAVSLCDAEGLFGASWSTDGFIYFGQGQKGILRVSDSGGEPETVVAVKGEEFAHGPQVLPGGGALLFTLAPSYGTGMWDKAQVVVQSLKSGDRKVLMTGGSDARYVPTGHLVYALGTTLLAVPFDAIKLQLTGSPTPVVEGVRRTPLNSQNAAAYFSFSNNGSMIYVPGQSTSARNLTLVDRDGVRTPLSIPPGPYQQPRISPTGTQLAVYTDDVNESIVSVYDLAGAAPMRRLTFGGNSTRPLWSRDGQRLVFSSNRDGNPGLFLQPADGSGIAERLATFEPGVIPQAGSWLPDGKTLIFHLRSSIGLGVAIVSVADQIPKPLIAAPANNPSLSPDGRLLAYGSTESGRSEVYVQPFPVTGAKLQVTTAGGDNPLWSPDGKQLFYLTLGVGVTRQIVAVDVQTEPSFAIRKMTPLPIDGIYAGGPPPYDILPDGKRFIVMLPQSAPDSGTGPPDQISVTLNWFEELNPLTPPR